MKNWTIIIVSLMLVLGLGGCKRSAANDPGGSGPAAYQITLKGTANPSTLFIPRDKPEVRSVITVRAIYNDGTPVVGKDVYFTLDTPVGYFGNYQTSVVRPTGGNGEVQVLYLIPAGTAFGSGGMLNVEARLYADNRLDNPLSEIIDLIPVQIVPAEYDQNPVTLSGHVKQVDGTGLEFALVQLKDTATGNTIVVISRASGSWDALVPYGWLGTVTATLSGFSFVPTSYTFSEVNPAYTDVSGLDFIAASTATYGALSVDSSEIAFITDGVTNNVYATAAAASVSELEFTVYVANSLNDNNIDYTVASSIPEWLTVTKNLGSTGTSLNSQDKFTVKIKDNDEANAIVRTGTITVTSITPGVNETVTITVTQDN